MLRDGILTSERVDQLNWAEEVFYRRLMSVVDDYGRYYAKPELLISACYPLRIRKVSDSDVAKFLAACASAGLVSTYQANDGKRYVQLVDFGQRIQAKSRFPGPDDGPPESTVENGGSPCSTEKNRLVEDVVEDVDGYSTKPSPAPPAPAVVLLPLNDGSEYPITQEQVSEFIALYPAVDVEQQFRAMRAWCVSNPAKRKTRNGIMRFANSWLAKEQDKGGVHGNPRKSTVENGGSPRIRKQLGAGSSTDYGLPSMGGQS